jgi:3-isopropylmalate dehydrogenase
MKYKIALIPGDGIGPELSEAALTVLDAVQQRYTVNLEIVKVDGGDGSISTRTSGRSRPTLTRRSCDRTSTSSS